MKNKGVWKVITKEQIPEGKKCVKSKWVFKIKKNGIFRERLVAYGYSQVSVINFTESYDDAVINDVSFRIISIGMIVWDLNAKIIDIETAFLHGG
jgi:hypothetical protein